jgi:hypothetical protein
MSTMMEEESKRWITKRRGAGERDHSGQDQRGGDEQNVRFAVV